MKCAYLNCEAGPTTTIDYWGEVHHVCQEHADLIGNDPPDEEQTS